ncbi:MAG: NAD(+) synthase [Bacteroidales bacterium]|nr:NAD(+) synthase [Bacteroidales bacterium]
MVKMKLAVATPRVYLADVDKNYVQAVEMLERAAQEGAQMIVFPPHFLTGATCGVLSSQDLLSNAASKAFADISQLAAEKKMELVSESCSMPEMEIKCVSVLEMVTRYRKVKEKLAYLSATERKAYVYCPSGYGESTAEGVYAGGSLVYCNGRLLAAGKRFQREGTMVFADIDTSMDPANVPKLQDGAEEATALRRLPFVPDDPEELGERCDDILQIQTTALVSRMEFINAKSAVIGISGGLDSTLALLVTCLAFDTLAIPRSNIIAVTMPGLGTSYRTKGNALALMEALGVTSKEISIVAAVEQHFKDIGHDPSNRDVTYENAQARERTQILMDLANEYGAFVVGTGDLSEIALGWCTFNGDHMSNYGVNCGVPKTLMREIVRHAANTRFEVCKDVLLDIVDTPVSPELVPGADGEIGQKTEEVIGPYELHDFFLYHFVRRGKTPRQIYRDAWQAFYYQYDEAAIKSCLRTFIRRFFNNQFKRSCSPEGSCVGSVSLSPRSSWPMPSDAFSSLWLSELDSL